MWVVTPRSAVARKMKDCLLKFYLRTTHNVLTQSVITSINTRSNMFIVVVVSIVHIPQNTLSQNKHKQTFSIFPGSCSWSCPQQCSGCWYPFGQIKISLLIGDNTISVCVAIRHSMSRLFYIFFWRTFVAIQDTQFHVDLANALRIRGPFQYEDISPV